MSAPEGWATAADGEGAVLTVEQAATSGSITISTRTRMAIPP
jgi:hypothetical protein